MHDNYVPVECPPKEIISERCPTVNRDLPEDKNQDNSVWLTSVNESDSEALEDKIEHINAKTASLECSGISKYSDLNDAVSSILHNR